MDEQTEQKVDFLRRDLEGWETVAARSNAAGSPSDD
jgi:hypothetical protein